MNEFTAKKLGEVLAFAQVGIETIERGRDALVSTSSDDKIAAVVDDLNMQAERIITVATAHNMNNVTATKAEGTGTKLRAMRELYVGDEWDNPAELLEWSSFFEGAAVGHWALVQGAAETLDDQELIELADDATDMHQDLLEDVCEALKKVGATKS